MIVKEYENSKAFLNEYELFLIEKEAVSQLIIYNALQNLTVLASEKCMFGAVIEEEKTVMLYCNVAPYNLVVYVTIQDKDMVNSASSALADFITNNHIMITGIIAKSDVCQSFIIQYKKNINYSFVEKQRMDIMEIRKVNHILPVEGIHRLALPTEIKLITDWIIQYQIEALASEMDYEVALNKITNYIENNQMHVYENEEQKLVSMAVTTRKLIHGMAISFVFTPEEFRGKGYAAANIYYMSKELLESGYEFCTLFVDKKNPVLNRAYEKLGYTIIEENYEYKISPIEA